MWPPSVDSTCIWPCWDISTIDLSFFLPILLHPLSRIMSMYRYIEITGFTGWKPASNHVSHCRVLQHAQRVTLPAQGASSYFLTLRTACTYVRHIPANETKGIMFRVRHQNFFLASCRGQTRDLYSTRGLCANHWHTCHISHCEIKSHRIWPIWKPIPIRFFKSHRIFRPSYNSFYVFITSFLHLNKGLWQFLESSKVISIKISQNFIKSPLKNCIISQISVYSLWHVCTKLLRFLSFYQ